MGVVAVLALDLARFQKIHFVLSFADHLRLLMICSGKNRMFYCRLHGLHNNLVYFSLT